MVSLINIVSEVISSLVAEAMKVLFQDKSGPLLTTAVVLILSLWTITMIYRAIHKMPETGETYASKRSDTLSRPAFKITTVREAIFENNTYNDGGLAEIGSAERLVALNNAYVTETPDR